MCAKTRVEYYNLLSSFNTKRKNKTTVVEFANNVDLDEAALYEPPRRGLH